jgi:beta-carotene hydroxylase
MLRYKEDRRSIAYMVITTALLVVQWSLPAFNPWLFTWAMFMAVTVAVMSHNHNHTRMWKSRTMNALQDYWLTLFYGFPVFAWIPTHNMNHHKFTNREGDYTVTWRYSEKNNLVTLLTYPSISSFFQQICIKGYLGNLWRTNRARFFHCIAQYVLLGTLYAVAFAIDWKKALLFIFIPHQFALFVIMIFNYLQHVHADEESDINHSRNIVGPLMNLLLFNNGYHTVHHNQPGMHWSRLPEAHAKIHHRIDPSLNDRSFWWLVIRTYLLGPIFPSMRTRSLRLERLEREGRPAEEPAHQTAPAAG